MAKMTLHQALHILLEVEHLEDWVYHVREHAREERSEEEKGVSSWDLKRVKDFSEAVGVLKDLYGKGII